MSVVALLADWANGIFAVLLASWWLGIDPLWWYFLVGMSLSHTPDLDAIPELLQRGKVAASADHPTDHREGLHYPVIIILLALCAAYLGGYWGLVFGIVLVLHITNDFYGTGWGIKLLWPFSRRNYKLFARRVNQLDYLLEAEGVQIDPAERRLQLIVSWSEEELPKYMTRWGIDDWIPKYYGTLNWISVTEYGLFVLAVSLMLYTLVY